MNKFFRLTLLALLILPLSAFCVRAEPEFGLGISPGNSDPYYEVGQSTTPEEFINDRFAVELANELLTNRTSDFWAIVEISTSQASQNLTLYVRRGFGRAELTTLILLSEKTGKKLSNLARERIEGATLRELCVNNDASYDDIRQEARHLKGLLLERMRRKLENQPYEPRESSAVAISTDAVNSIEQSTGTTVSEPSGDQSQPSIAPAP